VGIEQIDCPEALFNPTFIGRRAKGLHQSAERSISKCRVNFAKELYGRQTVIGSTPKGHATKYKYYLGKLQMQREEYSLAEAPLLWASKVYPKSRVDLKSNILSCLVAVRLRLGVCPTPEFLQQNGIRDWFRKKRPWLFIPLITDDNKK